MSPLVWFANFFSRRITRSSNQVIFYDQFWLKLSSTKSPVWSKFLDFKVKLVQNSSQVKHINFYFRLKKQISWYWRISKYSLDHMNVSRSEYSYQVFLHISNYFRFFSSSAHCTLRRIVSMISYPKVSQASSSTLLCQFVSCLAVNFKFTVVLKLLVTPLRSLPVSLGTLVSWKNF